MKCSRQKATAKFPPLVFAILVCWPAAGSGGGPDNPDTLDQALAILQSLNADLLHHDSATLTLDRWCETHRLATPADIVADRVPGIDKPPTAEQRKILQVSETELVRYRRVRLRCGNRVLSEAENWYVPSRLTPEMNKTLDTTNIPFGGVVQSLHFKRQTLSAKLLWSPEMLQVPPEVLQHRAVLTLPDGTPFSTVIETYTDDVLALPEP